MDQLPFEWSEPLAASKAQPVQLDPETIDATVALMARALLEVVRSTQEDDDETRA